MTPRDEPTPETDALAQGMIDRPMSYDGLAVWNHAKKLERDRNRLREQLAAESALAEARQLLSQALCYVEQYEEEGELTEAIKSALAKVRHE